MTDHESRWFMGSPRGTNHTGKLNGIGRGLMCLDNVPVDDAEVAIVYDIMYAANQTQEKWEPKAHKAAIKLNKDLLATVAGRRAVHFVNVKGHSGSEGNDCADEWFQWEKDGGLTIVLGKEAAKGQGGLHRWRRMGRS